MLVVTQRSSLDLLGEEPGNGLEQASCCRSMRSSSCAGLVPVPALRELAVEREERPDGGTAPANSLPGPGGPPVDSAWSILPGAAMPDFSPSRVRRERGRIRRLSHVRVGFDRRAAHQRLVQPRRRRVPVRLAVPPRVPAARVVRQGRPLRQARRRHVGPAAVVEPADARGVGRRRAGRARRRRRATGRDHREGIGRRDGDALRGDAPRSGHRHHPVQRLGAAEPAPTTSRPAHPEAAQAEMLRAPYMPPSGGPRPRRRAAPARRRRLVGAVPPQRGQPEHLDRDAALVVLGGRPGGAPVRALSGAGLVAPRVLDRRRSGPLPGRAPPERPPRRAPRRDRPAVRGRHRHAGGPHRGVRDRRPTAAADQPGARDGAVHGHRRLDHAGGPVG